MKFHQLAKQISRLEEESRILTKKCHSFGMLLGAAIGFAEYASTSEIHHAAATRWLAMVGQIRRAERELAKEAEFCSERSPEGEFAGFVCCATKHHEGKHQLLTGVHGLEDAVSSVAYEWEGSAN